MFRGPVDLLMSVLRVMGDSPGGIARFLPCDIGANHGRLRHVE